MRVAPCLIVAASLCTGLVGCSTANRRPGGAGGGDSVFLGAGPSAAAQKPEKFDPIIQTAGPQPDLEGMVAGQVLDTVNGQPTAAKIRWVCLDDGKAEERPIDVATDTRGYYIIQGLKSGRRYKLVAKAKQDGRNLVGVTYTLAPNSRAVIKLQENLGKAEPDPSAPPPPVPPSAKGGEKSGEAEKKTSAVPAPERPASAQVAVPAWGPSAGQPAPNPGGGFGIGQPAPLAPARPPNGSVDRTRIAEEARAWQPPVAKIRSMPNSVNPRPEPVPVYQPPLQNAAPVPSCAVVGKQVVNFALYDVSGRPWQYRTHKRGKLMLVDFWSTTCMPCLQTMPSLRQLNDRYGAFGLDVVGIAYESFGTPAEQAQHVSAAAQRVGANYPLLLGSGLECPVKTQFQVAVYPTLVLVGEGGWILWRHEGRPEPHHLVELERAIRMWLNVDRAAARQ